MRFLILYEEMATYFLSCLDHFARTEPCEILIFMKQINQVAPFDFSKCHPSIKLIVRESISEKELENQIREFNPDMTYLSGWLHKPYLKIIKELKLRNVIIGFDNQYKGSLKQLVGSFYFRIFLKPFIRFAFVPGQKQVQFAKLLGFNERYIATDLYCCDFDLYTSFYKNTIRLKSDHFPKRFLFVGRYVKEKGIDMLWESFIELCNETTTDWELWCIGKGNLEPVIHPQIKHLGFIQPDKLNDIISQTGVFILPSLFEPWGVVIHEYASAGYPILTTKVVGASEKFVIEGKNGSYIDPINKTEIKKALKKIITLNQTELLEMSAQSRKLAESLTPEIWKQSLLKLVYGNSK